MRPLDPRDRRRHGRSACCSGAHAVGFGTTLADLALMGAITGLLLGAAQALALPRPSTAPLGLGRRDAGALGPRLDRHHHRRHRRRRAVHHVRCQRRRDLLRPARHPPAHDPAAADPCSSTTPATSVHRDRPRPNPPPRPSETSHDELEAPTRRLRHRSHRAGHPRRPPRAAARPSGWSTAAARARSPDDVEVVGGDAGDPEFTTAVSRGRAGRLPDAQPAVPPVGASSSRRSRPASSPRAQAHGARLVSMENVYMYGRPDGRPLTEDRAHDAHTHKGRLRVADVPRPARRPSGRPGRGGHRARLRLLRAARRRPVQPRRPGVPRRPGRTHRHRAGRPRPAAHLHLHPRHRRGPGRPRRAPRRDRAGVAPPERPGHPHHPRARRRGVPAGRPVPDPAASGAPPAASRRRRRQPHRPRAPRDAVPVRRAVHRRQQQHHLAPGGARHPAGGGPRGDPRRLPGRRP